MFNRFKTRVILCALAALLAGDGVAEARQARDNYRVRVRILRTCTVVAADVDFGILTLVLGGETTASSIRVRCSKGTPFTVSYRAGTVNGAINGQMRGAAPGNTDRIPYRLTIPSTAGVGTGLGAADDKVFPVTARIRNAVNARADTYTQTRRVYVTY